MSLADRCWLTGVCLLAFEGLCLVVKVFSRMSLGELEAFISEQEKLASGADPEQRESPGHTELLDVRLGEKHCPEPGTGSFL